MSSSRPPAAGTWRLTSAAAPRLLGGGVLLVLGLLAGRPDVVALGVPLTLAAAWGLLHRPGGVSVVSLSDPHHDARSGRIQADVFLDPSPGASTSRMRISAPDHRDVEVLIDAGQRRTLRVAISTRRTGRLDVFGTDHVEANVGAMVQTMPRRIHPAGLLLLPEPSPAGELPLPPQLQGLTGTHRSRRPGDGGELRDIAVFGPGDRLRRIDWRATARRRGTGGGHGGVTDLYVRRTFAMSDAHVMLAMDARDAVGPDVATWDDGAVHPHEPHSLDVARRAAATLAQRYIDQGDRVGMIELGGRGRRVRPAGGRRHLHQLLHAMAVITPDGRPGRLVRQPRLPSGALAIVLSTFLDDDAAHLARTWRYQGHRVIAVDIAPTPSGRSLPPRMRTAYRIVEMERRDRLVAMRATGVEVVAWGHEAADAGQAAVALTALSRTRRAPR